MCEFSGVVHEILLEYVLENWLCLNWHVHTHFQRSAFSVKVNVIASILRVDSTRLPLGTPVMSSLHCDADQLSVNAWQIKRIIHISQFPVSWFYPPISRSRSSPGFTHCEFCSEEFTEKSIRDQVIEGASDGNIVEDLLQKNNLTLTKAISMCRSREAARSNSVDEVMHLSPLGSSDHVCLLWKFKCFDNLPFSKHSVSMYNYRKGNYEATNDCSESVMWSEILFDSDILEAWHVFKVMVQDAMMKYILTSIPKNNKTTPWWSKNLY